MTRNIYHKKPFTQLNKVLEGLGLEKLEYIAQSLFVNKDFKFYIVKITFQDYQAKIFSVIQVFRDLISDFSSISQVVSA